VKAEHRVQLDRVRRDAALAVPEVEEAEAVDGREAGDDREEVPRRRAAGPDDAAREGLRALGLRGARGTLDVPRRLYVAASLAVAGEADGRQAAAANPSN
jgi:hypothetical protein